MMADRKPPTSMDLRVFAALLCPFCALMAAWVGKGIDWPRLWVGAAIVILPVSVLGLVRPELIHPVYTVWMSVTVPIGRVSSLLLLSAIYVLLVTPIGLCQRLFGADPAARKRDPAAATYWIERSAVRSEQFFHPW